MRKATKFILVPVLVVTAVLLAMSAVQAYTIDDNYVGATPTSSSYNGKDVIGDESLFGISKMEVSYSGSALVVDIYTTYLNNIGKYETALGDLFISTNGWTPYGAAPYALDKAGLGESWEYALVLNTHTPNTLGGERSGVISLYSIDSSDQVKLSSAPTNYIYRADQEVQLVTDGLTALKTGTWSIGNWGDPDSDDYLRFAIDFGFGALSELGFHWTMTCGNDVIEGSAPVPEPATMLLLGTGLIGLAGFGRKRLLKK
jgi:hypothetical protein